MLRTRASRPDGRIVRWSPSAAVPLHTVPVTMVPAPASANARSTGRRKRSSEGRAATARPSSASAARSASRPAPVTADTSTTGHSRHASPSPPKAAATFSRISPATSARQSASGARSHLVSATTPRVTPRKRRMARCSVVCGITPSSAATTSSARSTPVAPATMFLMNPSCPGTSTTLASTSPSASGAKPMSIVMPRRFSSSRRSVSTPVRAFTSAVFP